MIGGNLIFHKTSIELEKNTFGSEKLKWNIVCYDSSNTFTCKLCFFLLK